MLIVHPGCPDYDCQLAGKYQFDVRFFLRSTAFYCVIKRSLRYIGITTKLRIISRYLTCYSLSPSFLFFNEGRKRKKTRCANANPAILPHARYYVNIRKIDVIRELCMKNYIALMSAWSRKTFLNCTIAR